MELQGLLPIFDEGMDAYVMLQAAKRRKERQLAGQEQREPQSLDKAAAFLTKGDAIRAGVGAIAGLIASRYGPTWSGGPGKNDEMDWDAKRAICAMASGAILGAQVRQIPRVLKSTGQYLQTPLGIATAGGAAAGAVSSQVGPSWAFGPTEEQINLGEQYSTRRALWGAAAGATLVSTVGSLPAHVQLALAAKDAAEAARAALYLVAPAGMAYSAGKAAIKGETPNLSDVTRTGMKGRTYGYFGRCFLRGLMAPI